MCPVLGLCSSMGPRTALPSQAVEFTAFSISRYPAALEATGLSQGRAYGKARAQRNGTHLAPEMGMRR